MEQYALENGTNEPKYIKDVARGEACNCYCEKCRGQLWAIQGGTYDWHFRHAVETDCPGSQETALHKLGKKIIAENAQLQTPKGLLEYHSPLVEENFETIRPDVIVTSQTGERVCIEVIVTHSPSKTTEAFYIEGKHKRLDIDLQDLPINTSPEDIKRIILEGTERKRTYNWEQESATSISGWVIVIGVLSVLASLYYFIFGKKRTRRR